MAGPEAFTTFFMFDRFKWTIILFHILKILLGNEKKPGSFPRPFQMNIIVSQKPRRSVLNTFLRHSFKRAQKGRNVVSSWKMRDGWNPSYAFPVH